MRYGCQQPETARATLQVVLPQSNRCCFMTNASNAPPGHTSPPYVSWAGSEAAIQAGRRAASRLANAGVPPAACRLGGGPHPAPDPASSAHTRWGRSGRQRWGGMWGGRRAESRGGRRLLNASVAALLQGGERKPGVNSRQLGAMWPADCKRGGCGHVQAAELLSISQPWQTAHLAGALGGWALARCRGWGTGCQQVTGRGPAHPCCPC